MLTLTDRDSFKLAVMIYGLCFVYSVFLWRKGFRQDDRWNYGLILTAFVFHTLAMTQRGFSFDRCPINNLYEMTAFVSWTMVVGYLAIGGWPRWRFLGAFGSPLLFAMGVFALMPDLDRQHEKPEFTGLFPSLHAALILLSYGAFGLASISGLMYLSQEHDLKFDKIRALLSRLPSIQRLDNIAVATIGVGVAFLSVGLGMGASLLKQETGSFWNADPKIAWSLLVWTMYAALLLARGRFGFQGRRFATANVGGFVFVLLTFWGFSLISDIHNPQ